MQLLALDSCLSCCKTCDRYSEGRAGYVVKADLVAELYGCGVTTVLAADTNVKLGIYGTAEGYCHVHKLTNTGGVELSEGIVLEDLCIVVSIEELTCVITREAIGHLSKVVSTEAEEVCVRCDLISGKACS